jgi:hypothetical protein
MHWCCPEGHGCNAPKAGEPCALSVCQDAVTLDTDAAVAVARWQELRIACQADHNENERRFRRRAFARARDRALIGLALRALNLQDAPLAAVPAQRRKRRDDRADAHQAQHAA